VAPIPGLPCLTGLLYHSQYTCSQGKILQVNVLRDGEFSEVVANHLWLDLDLVELLSRVDTDNRADHLGDDDHVTEMSLDEVWLLVWLGLLLGLAELLDHAHRLALKTAVEATASASMDDIAELVRGEVEESERTRVSTFAPLCILVFRM
jgi:hypothetical protein